MSNDAKPTQAPAAMAHDIDIDAASADASGIVQASVDIASCCNSRQAVSSSTNHGTLAAQKRHVGKLGAGWAIGK